MTTHDTFTKIAREHLGIETLEPRGRDALDFHDVGVASLKDALDAAYHAGQAEILAAATALLEAKDNQMLSPTDWRRLRRAVRRAHKQNTRPWPLTRASVVFRGDAPGSAATATRFRHQHGRRDPLPEI